MQLISYDSGLQKKTIWLHITFVIFQYEITPRGASLPHHLEPLTRLTRLGLVVIFGEGRRFAQFGIHCFERFRASFLRPNLRSSVIGGFDGWRLN